MRALGHRRRLTVGICSMCACAAAMCDFLTLEILMWSHWWDRAEEPWPLFLHRPGTCNTLRMTKLVRIGLCMVLWMNYPLLCVLILRKGPIDSGPEFIITLIAHRVKKRAPFADPHCKNVQAFSTTHCPFKAPEAIKCDVMALYPRARWQDAI